MNLWLENLLNFLDDILGFIMAFFRFFLFFWGWDS